MNSNPEQPPVIDYEGSDYQTSFWDEGGREYEDQSERIALKRLLPDQGNLLLEIGAGAGRNTSRYSGYQRVILLDYSLSQLQGAQEHLGRCDRFIYVAGDVYRLPFVENLFDGATMIRTLHHMKDPLASMRQIQRVLKPESPFILEYANKQNLKAILRYLFGRQEWNPFSLEAVEFTELNFDFHPKSIRKWLTDTGFKLERQLTVSHFRINVLKKWIPTRVLVFWDSIFQLTGGWWQLSPSVFTRNQTTKTASTGTVTGFFQCPACRDDFSDADKEKDQLLCPSCGVSYPIIDGIYDFRGLRS
jgi:ubiquinone/menaquinone biosynthesis C-methylase UbiE